PQSKSSMNNYNQFKTTVLQPPIESKEYTSQAFASTLATELPAIISCRQIFLVGQSVGGTSVLRTVLLASTETTPT
ncbi:hypothetical protein QPX08_04185, partial [Corynebacterium propinquum]|nr:hypothetical protein [Corynebacterium propinquum]